MSETLSKNMTDLGRRLRLGFVGGGAGSGIGATHRYAARLDGKYEIVAGAFDIDPEKGRAFAAGLFLDPARVYDDVGHLIAAEKKRADPVDVVAVLTPNHTHYAISAALVDAGFDVICEKPLTTTMDDARAMLAKIDAAGTLMAINYGYSGYPMVRQAKAMIARGDFGRITLVQSEWAFGNQATMTEEVGGHWRTKPGLVGRAAVLNQIGTHAVHTASLVSGLALESLSADLSTFIEGRALEDNAQILLRFADGARGALWVSYVAAGAWHGFRFKVFGEKGGLEWVQEDPNHLLVHTLGGERRLLTRAGVGATKEALAASRIAPAHPEGFIEAIANLYGDFAEAVAARKLGRMPAIDTYPNQHDGALGVHFIDAAVESSARDGAWVDARMPKE